MRRRVVFPPKLAVLHNSIQFSSSSRDGRSIMSSEERHIENWVIFEGEREREREREGGGDTTNQIQLKQTVVPKIHAMTKLAYTPTFSYLHMALCAM